jgi:hypothetical protein
MRYLRKGTIMHHCPLVSTAFKQRARVCLMMRFRQNDRVFTDALRLNDSRSLRRTRRSSYRGPSQYPNTWLKMWLKGTLGSSNEPKMQHGTDNWLPCETTRLAPAVVRGCTTSPHSCCELLLRMAYLLDEQKSRVTLNIPFFLSL